MKTFVILAAFNIFAISLLGQQPAADRMGIIKRTWQQNPRSRPNPLAGQRGRRIAVSDLLSPQKLSGFIKGQGMASPVGTGSRGMGGRPAAGRPAVGRQQARVLGGACSNLAFFEKLAFTNSSVGVTAMAHTQDDGVLIAGETDDTTTAHPGWQFNAFLLKSDNSGNILWVTLLVDQNADPIYYLDPNVVKEMPGGGLMMAAYINTATNPQASNDQPVTTIYRLSNTGAIIWHTELESTLLQSANNEWSYFNVKDINPGLNGDYIIAGTTIGSNHGAVGMTVVRMDMNGNYIWDTNLTNYFGDAYDLSAEGLNAYLNGSNIVAIGVSHGNGFDLTAPTFFATLDYATGAVGNKIFWANNYANPATDWEKNFTYYSDYAVQLSTGHYLVYSELLSAVSGPQDTLYYFSVQEFDAGFNFVQEYLISSTFYGNGVSGDDIYFDNNGNGFFAWPQQEPGAIFNDYFSTIRNGRIARQRVFTYSGDVGALFFTQPAFMNDGSCFAATYYEDPVSGSYIAMKKMYDADTSSSCLGRDTSFAFELPLTMSQDPGFLYLDPPESGQIKTLSYAIGPAGIAYRTANGCAVNSSCQLLKIQGQGALCGVSQPVVYKALRNTGCGATPQWTIDTSVVSSLTQVDDTTVSILFKNVNWSGKLYASLLPGACETGVGDSLVVAVVSTPQAPDLAADTILCSGDTILLHAGPVYNTYSWQDGNTDSVYAVTASGVYTVAVTDFCGNNYSSSTQVVAANFPFSLGPDIGKCNSDTVVLKATGGFTNYQWSAINFSTGGQTDSVIKVAPGQNTGYSVTAEKWAGCNVQAAVQVLVYHSPVIQLGDDTSFCSGGSMTLDAGTGFANYVWSTGQSAQQIVANQTGTYSVAGTTNQGCKSYDTLSINVNPLPVFLLGSGPDTSICSNLPLQYSFSLPGDSFQWSDGSSAFSRVIDQPGTYGLTVENPFGCSSSQSITVVVMPAPQVDLGADTTLCAGKDIVLDAVGGGATGGGTTGGGASYLWQDGSTGPEFTVSSAGIYFAKVTVGGCSSADTIVVGYTGLPEFTLGADTVLCQGMEFMLQPVLSYTGTYQWQDGSDQNFYLVRDTGIYTLSVSNNCGTGTSSVKVIPGLCSLVMPSAFTPNNDGRNDLFRVKYPFTVSKFRMAVYNRWGMLVFQTGNIDDGWDGTYRGAPQPAGTYVWYITLVDIHNKVVSQKGTVILIR